LNFLNFFPSSLSLLELSVLDLLRDEEPNGNEEVRPMHEDHVAFSVEGMVLVLDLKPRLYSSTHTDTSLVSVFNISKVNLEADYLLNNINYYLLLLFF
jgi:hypothetical protein